MNTNTRTCMALFKSCFAIATLGTLLPAQVLLSDDFSGGLDPQTWSVATNGIPQGGASVSVQNGACSLINRGTLVTNQNFDVTVLGGYRVTCTWRWTDAYDRFQLLLRSDGVPGGPYGETQNGVELIAGIEGGPSAGIGVRGASITLSPETRSGPGVQFMVGPTYTASFTDTGTAFRVRIDGPGGEWSEFERSIASGASPFAHIVFHNRENMIGSHLCVLDDVRIERLPLATLQTFGVGCAGTNGTPNLAPASGSLPVLGQTFTALITNTPNSPYWQLCLPFLGFDNVQSSGIPLPRNLTPLGMPGCTQYVDPFQVTFLFYLSPVATWSIAVPNVPSFAGIHFYLQAALIDLPVNALGLTATNALDATLGW